MSTEELKELEALFSEEDTSVRLGVSKQLLAKLRQKGELAILRLVPEFSTAKCFLGNNYPAY
jgi:hypothetical protein